MRVLLVGFDQGSPAIPGSGTDLQAPEARTPEQADRLLGRGSVEAILVGPEPWAHSWFMGLPAHTRPAVLVAGASTERVAAEADDWAAAGVSGSELLSRLRVALLRGRLRRRAVRRGNVDPLTALPNRRGVIVAVLRAAARSRRQATRLSLVLIDLDYFKRVNEQEGHDAGDRLLRKVGLILNGSTRKDEFCGRVGGDEFIVVVAGDAKQADLVCRRIQLALLAENIPATCAGQELGRGENLRELYRRVDAQLRARKRQRAPGAAAPSPGATPAGWNPPS